MSFRDTFVPVIESPMHLIFKRSRVLKYSVKEEVVVRFIKDLAVLIKASVPLVKSLDVLARQQRDRNFNSIVRNLARSVDSGISFSNSLKRYPSLFDMLLISMISAGEASCSLGEVLGRIARHKEKELQLRKKIKSIMIYPCIVIFIATLIVSFLFLFIIPKFESVFSSAFNGSELPWATRLIIAGSHSFRELSILLLVILVGLFLIIKFVEKRVKDKMILKLPLVGYVIRDINIALFSRMLGTLLANGVPLTESLKISENIATNYAIKNSLMRTRKQVEDGELLSNTIESEAVFPGMAIGMIHVGEETGTLSDMLLEVASKLEDDIEQAIERMTSILEPLMTLLLAVIIGSIVIALFLPIVNVMNSIGSF